MKKCKSGVNAVVGGGPGDQRELATPKQEQQREREQEWQREQERQQVDPWL